MFRLAAATRRNLTSDHLQVYVESGERQDGRMWGLGPVGEADRMILAGHLARENLPETILTNATVAAFLAQVRAMNFSTPRLIDVELGDDPLIVISFRDFLT